MKKLFVVLNDKKSKYLIHSIVISGLLLWFIIAPTQDYFSILLSVLVVLFVGSFITHYPNIKLTNILATLLLPIHLIVGVLLSLIFFPNLSAIFKLVAVVVFGLIFYVFSLVNNVFLVVEEKNELIPLYRVAVTWAQIILTVIAIPFFAGVFKISINMFLQSLLISFSSILFCIYMLWVMSFDNDSKKFKVGEGLIYGLFVGFLVFVSNIAVSFVPHESFLKALLVSSFMVFGVSLICAHLKNTITKEFIRNYVLIFSFILLIFILFKP